MMTFLATTPMGGMGLSEYNYWLIVVLMMTGLYLVISRSNMVKTIIGLNMFQVAVILFYVSMAKVSGGTAPIEIPQLTDAGIQVAVLVEAVGETGQVTDEQVTQIHEIMGLIKEVIAVLPDGDVASALHDDSVRQLGIGAVQRNLERATMEASESGVQRTRVEAVETLERTLSEVVVYSNPLPHVLMLTAIVVGIATIALALALVVRINEAYDTIEEDEILALEANS